MGVLQGRRVGSQRGGQVDFAFYGDFPAVLARARGLKTRLVLPTSVRSGIYIAVPPDSPVRRIEDLRGRQVSLFRGTNWSCGSTWRWR